jgi:predicted transcriptional regulator YdeE
MQGTRIRVALWSVSVLVLCGAFAGALAFARQKQGDASANPREERQEPFTMIGISARTSNARERTDSQIGKQWSRLIQDNLLATIPNRADQNVVAVYTDYASDANGDYTFVLGAKVTKEPKDVPAGMVVKRVLGGKYAVFTSERGPVQQVVVATWMRIWRVPKDQPGGDRSYKTDFEVYDQRAQNPSDTVMEIHIGIH